MSSRAAARSGLARPKPKSNLQYFMRNNNVIVASTFFFSMVHAGEEFN